MCTITQQRVEEKFALGMRGNTVNVRRRVGTQKVNVFAHWVRNTDGVETRKVDSTIGDSKTHTERIEVRGYTLNAKDTYKKEPHIVISTYLLKQVRSLCH